MNDYTRLDIEVFTMLDVLNPVETYPSGSTENMFKLWARNTNNCWGDVDKDFH